MKLLAFANLIAISLSLDLGANPQACGQEIRFRSLSVEDGLSHPFVTSIVRDHDGFIWVGTHDGLNRYDGYQFKVFRHDPGDSTSLTGSDIWCLLVDRHGILWIGTLGCGLNSYDPSTGKFLHHNLAPGPPGAQDVWSLFEGRDDTLWVGMDGLHGLDTRTGGQIRYAETTTPALSSNIVRSIFEDSNGTLWIGTWFGGLNMLDQKRAHVTVYRNSPGKPPLLSENHIISIHQDRQGALWLGTYGAGVNKFDPSTGRAVLPFNQSAGRQGLRDPCVKAIYEDQEGRLWFGTGAGVDILDRRTMRITSQTHDESNPTSIGGGNISAIYEDLHGTAWVATNAGISMYDLLNNRFKVIPRRHESGYIGKLSADTSGALWISDGSPELRHFDPITGSVQSYPLPVESIAGTGIAGLYADRFGLVWLITDGLDSFDPVTRVLKHYRIGNADSMNASFSVNGFYEDRRADLWIGTTTGIARYDRARDTFVYYGNYTTGSRRDSGLSNVQSIVQDQTGVYWLGTEYGGLIEFDPDRGIVSRFTHNIGEARSIGSNNITAVHEDRSGRLWLATHSAGIDLFDRATRSFAHLGKEEGLAADFVCGLVEDERGLLWISTPKGLSCYNPETREVRTYDAGDGMNGLQEETTVLSRTGGIFVGNERDLFCFRPSDLPINRHVPNVVITSFMVLNEPFPLPGPVHTVREIVLDHTQNFFSFEFVSLDFVAPAKNQYAYRLEGVDEEWVQSGTRRFANYTHLDPGTYQFRVKGSNNDGVWNETGTSLTIVINPPFWATWWFRGLAAIAMLGFLALAYNVRVNRLLALERIRVRIARDLHDELGSNLSGIALASRLMQSGSNLTEQQQHRLNEITKGAMRTAEAMREIVWFINPEHDDPGDLVIKMRELASVMLEGVKVSFDARDDVFERSMGIEKRRQLFLLFKEVINNIVKHARCAHVSISLQRRGGTLTMSVADDGVGFVPESVSAGDGLRNLERRAAALGGQLTVESSSGKGTRITLHVKTT